MKTTPNKTGENANNLFKYHASSQRLTGHNILNLEKPELFVFNRDDLGFGKRVVKNDELCDNNLLETNLGTLHICKLCTMHGICNIQMIIDILRKFNHF
jgi:hypothetical protein